MKGLRNGHAQFAFAEEGESTSWVFVGFTHCLSFCLSCSSIAIAAGTSSSANTVTPRRGHVRRCPSPKSGRGSVLRGSQGQHGGRAAAHPSKRAARFQNCAPPASAGGPRALCGTAGRVGLERRRRTRGPPAPSPAAAAASLARAPSPSRSLALPPPPPPLSHARPLPLARSLSRRASPSLAHTRVHERPAADWRRHASLRCGEQRPRGGREAAARGRGGQGCGG